MKVQTILEEVGIIGQPNQAIQYLIKLMNQISTNPTSITKLDKAKRDKIAYILTGLYIISNFEFRRKLKVSDGQYSQIVTQLLTNSVAANYVYNAGKRLPSMVKLYTDQFDGLHLLTRLQKQLLITNIKKIHAKLV